MTLNARALKILNRLVYSHSPVSVSELMAEENNSRTTIYHYIKNINSWLTQQRLQPVYSHRHFGFYITSSEKNAIKEKLGRLALYRDYQKSPQERAAWIGVLLLTREEPVFMRDLLAKLKVSRRTAQRDVQKLREQLNPYQLELQFEQNEGYHITGSEQAKRKILVNLLTKIHPQKESHWFSTDIGIPVGEDQDWSIELFSSKDAAAIYQILFESEQYLKVHYPDDMIEILSLHLLFLLKRYRQGKLIHMDPVEKVVLKPSEEYKTARYIGERMESNFSLAIPDDELCYISVCLMGAKTEEYSPNSVGEEELAALKVVIEKMVADFEADFLLAFRNKHVLERSLFFHLKSAYYRIIYGLEFENPLSEMIINNYPRLFQETKKVIHHLEQAISKTIPDDEIALITIHFGGWIENDNFGA